MPKAQVSSRTLMIAGIIGIVVLAILPTQTSVDLGSVSKSDIAALTDQWIRKVTVEHDPVSIGKMFCPDGNLVGTVSQVKRTGKDIQKYFDYFAKLPGIRVLRKEYNITEVTPQVYINTAFITWSWQGIEEPIVARMSFIFREQCIFQLHSSALPDLNENLVRASGSI